MIGLLLAVLVIAGVGVLLSRYISDMRVHAAVMVGVAVLALGTVALLSR